MKPPSRLMQSRPPFLPYNEPFPKSGEQFFLRVGRAIRQELGEFADARPEYVGKTGYMRSTNTWMAPLPSFFPGVIDAPFGRTLQIGGHFGADFLTSPRSDNLYYTVSFWAYTGDPDDPYDPAHLSNEKQILSHLFNKKYLLPTTAFPKGKWETLDLGPFEGTITAVEPTLDPALVGTTVHVYKRPSLADLLTEYWPFWDLIAIWNSNTAPDGLVVFTLEVYEKSGGTDENPELTKLEMTPSINGHLPLVIDNRRPVPKLFNWRTAFAQFSPETVIFIAPFGSCGEMPVSVGHVNSNECILVEYSIEDQDGNPHPHINHYNLWIEFTPRQVVGAPLSKILTLKGQGDSPANPPFGIGLGYRDINGSYEPGLSGSPVYTVQNHESVLVPNIDDGWPPEPAGDPPSPCVQYAAEVGLRCSVRTINGWGRLFGNPHNSRHIIIRRG